jgi:hypothetical protein
MVPVPRVVVPLRNVTVPPGVALPVGPVTVAVKATLVPETTLAADAVNAVVVARGFTATVVAEDMDALSPASPP